MGENDERIDMKDRCISVFPAISYTATGSIWKTSKTEETVVANNNDLRDITMSRSDHTSGGNVSISYGWDGNRNLPCLPYSYKIPGMNDTNKRQACAKITTVDKVSFKRYCLNGVHPPYDIPSLGATVDIENSTETPTYTSTRTDNGCLSWAPGGYQVAFGCSGAHTQFLCSEPKCNLTTIEARPTFVRADGSEYIDMNSTLETKYVCGDGSTLQDVRQ
jgi:hypothetical protein